MDVTNYNDGNWHGWNGGECPVHPETVVEVATAERGIVPYLNRRAGVTKWRDAADPIIAFRVIKEHKPAREWWCVMSHMFGSEDKAKTFLDALNGENPGMNFGQVYKVREVLE